MHIVILGAGGYGRTVADVAVQLGYTPIILDDNSENKCDTFAAYHCPVIPAFGNNELRLLWCRKIKEAGCALATLIHPSAYVSPTCAVAEGVVILPHAVVNTGTAVGTGAIINIGALIDHDCVLEDGVHVCVGAVVKGENRLSRCMKAEAGSIIERGTYKK